MLCILVSILAIGRSSYAARSGRDEYLGDCARCRGADGKGESPQMRAVPGYISVDLTRLAANNNGEFPRQEVYHSIDGRKRFPAHFIGDMPAWGGQYQHEQKGTKDEDAIHRRILLLVNYVESLQVNQNE